MLAGAIIKRITGTDLDAALTDETIAAYLSSVAGWETVLFANLSLWIAGVLLLGLGGYLLASTSDGTASRMARAAYLMGPPLAITSFVAWMALIRLSVADLDLATADALAFISSRVDWIATVLVVAIGPVFVSITGKGSWVPRWLYGLGMLAGVGGIVTIVAMYTGGLSSYGVLLVPIGIAWTIGSAVTALRLRERTGASRQGSDATWR